MALNYQMLGKRIQQIRNARKLSQFQLAELIGTSPTFVSHIERGTKGPSLETLILIADALHTSIDLLLTESRMNYPETRTDEFSEMLKGCSPYERFVLLQTLKNLKVTIQEGEKIRDLTERSIE